RGAPVCPTSLSWHGAARTATYTLALHDALPILLQTMSPLVMDGPSAKLQLDGTLDLASDRVDMGLLVTLPEARSRVPSSCSLALDRKSTRLNSSHVKISYAVFCLKKKKYQSHKW